MAKRNEVKVGQKWAYVSERQSLQDDMRGRFCVIAPYGHNKANDVDVYVEEHYGSQPVVERITIKLWQLKELWHTFESKRNEAREAFKKAAA